MAFSKLTVAVLIYLNVVYTVFGAYPYALRCRKCVHAAYVSDCHEWEQCEDNEVCYMDEVVTEGLVVYYNAGCRAKTLCEKSVGQDAVRRKREKLFISCSRCCNDEPFCNEELCSIQKDTDAVLCYQCGYKDSVNQYHNPTRYASDCSYIGACNPGEACFLKATTDHTHEGQLLYYSKCMPLSVCQYVMAPVFAQDTSGSALVGKREPNPLDISSCSVCCGDDRCNGYNCNVVKERYKSLYNDGFLNVTTLREIF